MKLSLKGNYAGNPIRISIRKSRRKTNNVALFIHGSYGLSGDKGSKSLMLGKQILHEGLAHVAYYSSSRDWNTYFKKEDDAFSRAFSHKTFYEELDDLSDTLKFLIANSESLFSAQEDRFKIYVIANSLGGTLISMLASKFSHIEKMALCGSGLAVREEAQKKPIMSTFPGKKDILKETVKYTKSVFLLQGSRDSIVPQIFQDELLDGFKNAKTKKKVVEGANHNFSNIHGENKDLAYNIYCNSILDYLKSHD
ncbi:MAG: hypothetical protein Q7S88_03025 [Candidatus Daviesbacteria bacterium]|nr:hypothetical protein [Candidatus Daviesbacteria bacterium]